MEFLRDIAHLRPRTNTFGAVFRIRHNMAIAIHQFFHERGFFYFHTPLITASDCEGAGQYDEERWNYAFWRQDESPVIDPDTPNELTDILFDWYKENGITNIGEEDDDCYDENYNYIGKGPVGHYELLGLVSNVAKRLQQEAFIENKFGRKLPIIIHGLEYAWFDIEATQNANINGEADVFLKAVKELGMC